MRVLILSLLTWSLWTSQARVAFAHLPGGKTYRVFQFPDSLLPSMDGDLGDWQRVPEAYWIGTAALKDTEKGQGTRVDEEDLGVRVAVGWNQTHNRLYFAVEAQDDVLNIERGLPPEGIWGGDIFEIVVDADHSGGIYNGFSAADSTLENRWRSAQAQNYHVFFPPQSQDWTMWLWGKAQWTCKPPFAAVGWKYEGVAGGKGKVHQELWVTPFGDLHWAGPDSSLVHQLQEGQIIGVSWSFLDFDASDEQYDGFWNLSHNSRMDHTADLLLDFVLEPTAP